MSPASRRVLVVNEAINSLRVRVELPSGDFVREMPIPPQSHETVLLFPGQRIIIDEQP